MVSRPLAVAAVAAVLVAGVAGLTMAETGQQTTADNATVSVSADADVERAPDRAVVTVVAVGRGDTAEAARNDLSGAAQSVQQALRDEGATVTSSQFRIEPEYERTDEGRQQVGYIAVHTVEAETDDVNTTGVLVDAAIDAGADRVEGIRYGLSEQTREQAREAALTEAMDRARTDAETVAGAEGRTVGAAISVQTSGQSNYLVRAETAAAGAGGQTTVSPGPVTVDASVQVTYELN